MKSATIDFAKFNADYVTEFTNEAIELVENHIYDVGEYPHALRMFASQCVRASAGLAALGRADGVVKYLRWAGRASAALFVHTIHDDEDTTIAFDDEHLITFSDPIDPSLASAPVWLEAMWGAMGCGDLTAQALLAAIPNSQLSPLGVQFAPYALPTVDLLRSLFLRDGKHGAALVEALKQCNAQTPLAVSLRDWSDALEFPALKALLHLLSDEEAEFDVALSKLLDSHRRFHAAGGLQPGNDELISLRACALRRLAAMQGLGTRAESAYMPPVVWRAPLESPLTLCPYCLSPKPEEAPRCALCGEPPKDAPFEVAANEYLASSRKPCQACGYSLHGLAVRCPSCRARQ